MAETFRTTAYWLLWAMYALSFIVVFVPFLHGSQLAQSLGLSAVTGSLVI